MALVNFYSITAAQYEALEIKDTNALYFLDNGLLYKGNLLVSNTRLTNGFLTRGEKDTLYIDIGTGQAKYYTGTQYLEVTKQYVTTIDELNETSNDFIPTVFAVKKYFEKASANYVPSQMFTELVNKVNALESKMEQSSCVLSYETIDSFPASGALNIIYIEKSTEKMYRWNEIKQKYIQLGESIHNIQIIDASF